MANKKTTRDTEDTDRKTSVYSVSPVSFNLNLPAGDKTKPTAGTTDLSNQILDIAEVMPQYAGCEAAVNDSIDCTFLKVVSHIKANLKYPE